MDDLISRTWLLAEYDKRHKGPPGGARKLIEEAPPAQPESCEDTVSRQRLLSDLKELVVAWEKYPVMAEQIKGVEAAIGYVKTIPTAHPKHTEERTETHACDSISRQTVLDAIDEISREVDDGDGFDYAKWREYFCELPPALGTNLAEVGTDAISRQQAIDIVFEYAKGLYKHVGTPEDNSMYSYGRGLLLGIERNLKELPPAEPKRGKWILDRSGAYCCSKCMEPCAGYVMMKPRDKFCKMCGSRNEVTEC